MAAQKKKLTFANVSNKVKQPLGKDLVNNELLVKKLRNVFRFCFVYVYVCTYYVSFQCSHIHIWYAVIYDHHSKDIIIMIL